MTTYYAASEDCENWTNDDLKEALYLLMEDMVDEDYKTLKAGSKITVYSGESVQQKASMFLPDIDDRIREQACDEGGEWSEDWCSDNLGSDLDAELLENISVVVDKFYDKHDCQPNWWIIEDIKAVNVKLIRLVDCSDFDFEVID
jgi:hypothetical protein